MSEQQCPLCKSDSYLNPNIKMLVSPCFHRLCEQCVYRLFAHGYAPCPECQAPLRRINFITSTFEDVEVEREIRIRKVLSSHFSRREEEFKTILDYHDYLEAFEDAVFELLALKNEALVKEKIAQIKLQSNNILNPTQISTEPQQPRIRQEQVKKVRLAKALRRIAVGALPIRPRITKDVSIPPELPQPYAPGGLTRSTIIGYIIESLFD